MGTTVTRASLSLQCTHVPDVCTATAWNLPTGSIKHVGGHVMLAITDLIIASSVPTSKAQMLDIICSRATTAQFNFFWLFFLG